MIPELRQQTFISLVKAAKKSEIKHPKHIAVEETDPFIGHLTLRNQRRIKRYRAGLKNRSAVAALLHKEVIEHRLTRDHLGASVEKLISDSKKEDLKEINKRLSQVKSQITKLKKNKKYSKKRLEALEQKAQRLSSLIKKI